jgi:hypothetical protein
MFQLDFDPAPTTVRIHRCKYVSQCKARSCLRRATLIAENVDTAGRHVRQIELCPLHCEIVVERKRVRGLEICARRQTLGAKIDPDPIFSEMSLEAILFAYSSDANSLARTRVHERFYAARRQNLDSESGNESQNLGTALWSLFFQRP